MLDRIGGRYFSMVIEWKTQERERVDESAVEDRYCLYERRPKSLTKFRCRPLRCLVGNLCEDVAEARRDVELARLRHMSENIAKEMDLAALPARTLEDDCDRRFEPFVCIADNELRTELPVTSASSQPLEKPRPALLLSVSTTSIASTSRMPETVTP